MTTRSYRLRGSSILPRSDTEGFSAVLKQKDWLQWLRYHSAWYAGVLGRWTMEHPLTQAAADPPFEPVSRQRPCFACGFSFLDSTVCSHTFHPILHSKHWLIMNVRAHHSHLWHSLFDDQRPFMNWYPRKRTEDTLLRHPSHLSLGVLSHLSISPPKPLPKRSFFQNPSSLPCSLLFSNQSRRLAVL